MISMNKHLSYTFFLFLFITVALAQKNVNNTQKGFQVNSPHGTCPFPLISLKSTGLSGTDTSLCLKDCCLPCPIANTFYETNQIDLIFHVLSVIRVISFVCILVIVVSYIILPNKRENPAMTVLCFNSSLLIFLGVTFFYIGDMKKVQCADLVNQSTIKNNTLCGVQGVVLIFTTFLLILWCFLLILHLHFQTLWRSNAIQRYYLVSQVLVIILAATFTILPAALGKISFEFGAVCLVSRDFQNALFWYPLAIFVVPGFFIHLWTFLHIGKSHLTMSMDYCNDSTSISNISSLKPPSGVTGQEIVRAIKVQWRALMLASIFTVTYIIYMIYAMVELNKIHPENFLEPVQPWFSEWLTCIFQTGMNNMNAQDAFSVHAIDHIPNMSFIAIAESLTASLGISIFIIFGTSIDLWSEWRLYFINKYNQYRR